MNARDAILAAVRAARPDASALPEVSSAVRAWQASPGEAYIRFVSAARTAGARVVECDRAQLTSVVAEAVPSAGRTVSLVRDVRGTLSPPEVPHDYAKVDAFICEGAFGVAENGAVWLPASRLGCRAGAFLAQHLVIVLNRREIVEHLHAAYARLDWSSEEFGIFIAGPSKTADIEQAMVIGAHGPAALTIVLTDGAVASA